MIDHESVRIDGMRVTIIIVLTVCAASLAAFGQDKVDYDRDVRPILASNCFKCHGPDPRARKRRPRLDTFEGATARTRWKHFPIVPGKLDESEMYRRISSDDASYRMPPEDTGKQLTLDQIETIRRWIEQGAEYNLHWSYIKPVRSDLPEVSDAKWLRNGIDSFVLARLDEEGLMHSAEADRRTLIRRVYLDLIGLPPTPQEVKAFLKDRKPGAYERVVDELLARPQYGERWAQVWLDLARYADTKGYEKDDRRTIWKYRDWVIGALNADMPFTEFTIDQIAGDLLPEPTPDTIIATAFHRNTMNNDEGGTDDEEFRYDAVVDRVNTTMEVWMGTTMRCAQCHTHKYDPITQEEYFRVFAFFNQTADHDQPNEYPVYRDGSPEDLARLDEVTALTKSLPPEVEVLKKKLEEEKSAGADLTAIEAEYKAADKKLRKAKHDQEILNKEIIATPVMEELPLDKRRTTHIHKRGSFLNPGKEVTEGTPAVFQSFPEGQPANRLGLARWLVSDDNPLTARVTANRFWEQFFGQGIVKTLEEFGTQGEWPTHPELLDWLAVEFMDSGWSMKALCRTIVTSATYRQDSRISEELRERDPYNELLSRGPRFRLEAETMRDQALRVAGLLSENMYGPSVMPYQPEGVWTVVYSGDSWVTSANDDRYRRGLYTFWRRTSPYPSMMAFDATSREVCTTRRIRTNTPLQALVMLNDAVYVEAAQALARRIMTEGRGKPARRIDLAFEIALARPASDLEKERLSALYESELAHYESNPEQATAMATEPLGPLENGDVAEAAAWTVVCNVIMNLDEFLTKR
jgi:Protein of unknown function (DUF1553)/Protein of unknown function (DUF1549)/Planctomycete cytochrome C